MMSKFARPLAATGILLFVLFVFGDVIEGKRISQAVPGLQVFSQIKWLLLVGFGLAYLALWQMLGNAPIDPLYSDKGMVRERFGDPLLILRFFAFICVWMTHSYLNLKPDEQTLAMGTWSFWAIGCAHSGMPLFFTLSGFLMGKAFCTGRYKMTREGIRSFYLNRLLRILPLYFFSVITVTLILRRDLIDTMTLANWARIVFFNYYATELQLGPIGALWSLTTEMHFYLLVPLLMILFYSILRRFPHVTLAFALTLAIGVTIRFVLKKNEADWYAHRYTPLYANLDSFLSGLFLNAFVARAYLRETNFLKGASFYLSAALGCALLLYFVGSAWEYSPIWPLISTGSPAPTFANANYMQFLPTVVILLTCLVIYLCEIAFLAHNNNGATVARKNANLWKFMSAFQFLGAITYSMYVWHSPIIVAVGAHLPLEPSISMYLARSFLILLEEISKPPQKDND